MNLYSVLLVDDEEDVVRTIMVKTDWESLGYRVIGYAHNGVEALEIAEEYQPDVVMTDIKMPYMDGLTLGRKLKEMYPSVKIILFSGFDDFEYAKEAIKLEVEEYLLKPVDPSEISEIFRRIRDTLDKQRNERQNMDKLKEYYLQFFLNITEMLKSESIYALDDVIEKVQVYIRHNYQKDLNQDFIASLFYMNRSYLSTLFRQKTGMKFVDYLNDVRIEKSKEMLSGSSRKMYQISKAVGYDNPKYFFRIFKKKTGITPEQYREKFE